MVSGHWEKTTRSHGISSHPLFSRAQAVPNRARCCAHKAEAGQESFDDLCHNGRPQRFHRDCAFERTRRMMIPAIQCLYILSHV